MQFLKIIQNIFISIFKFIFGAWNQMKILKNIFIWIFIFIFGAIFQINAKFETF